MPRAEPPPASLWMPLLQETLGRAGRFRLPLRGDSMSPTLPVVCAIEVVPLPDQPQPGALVVFALGDALVAHRLVRRRDDDWIAQGDNRRAPDPPLSRSQLLGCVAAAYVGDRRVWPGPAERLAARAWVVRHYVISFARRLARR